VSKHRSQKTSAGFSSCAIPSANGEPHSLPHSSSHKTQMRSFIKCFFYCPISCCSVVVLEDGKELQQWETLTTTAAETPTATAVEGAYSMVRYSNTQLIFFNEIQVILVIGEEKRPPCPRLPATSTHRCWLAWWLACHCMVDRPTHRKVGVSGQSGPSSSWAGGRAS
jgi:hypothetical protein